jgi:hypothetical protein
MTGLARPTPETGKSGKTIDFAYPRGLVKSVLESLELHLQREPRPPALFSEFLRRHLIAAWQTFRGSLLLVSEVLDRRGEPRLPLPASILSRSLLDAYANVICLCEEPQSRTRLYDLDVLRSRIERFQAYKARAGARPENGGKVQAWEAHLQRYARQVGKAPVDLDAPTENLWQQERWPSPTRLRGKPHQPTTLLTGSRAAVFREVHDLWYPTHSVRSHFRDTALTIAVANEDADHAEIVARLVQEQVGYGLVMMACILSEIESTCGYPPRPKLRELWGFVEGNDLSGVVTRIYDLRYRDALRS